MKSVQRLTHFWINADQERKNVKKNKDEGVNNKAKNKSDREHPKIK